MNLGLFKLARTDSPLKEIVKLGVRPALGLRKTEKAPHQTDEVDAGPEEACFALPIPGGGVEHVGHQDAVENTKDVVARAR